MAAMQLHWDIFCRVIDNFGDAGVCWRLARQLVAEHGRRVRLWIDVPAALHALAPGIDPNPPIQHQAGVEVRHWQDDTAFTDCAEVVIEAFACDLPPDYLAKMAAAPRAPCWVNLEYLTAESWALGCHGLASPHPSLPLVKFFYFPGLTAASGGLLRERDLAARQAAWAGAATPETALRISLFCYDTAPVSALLDTLSATPTPVHCRVPAGKPLAAVRQVLGGEGPWQLGALMVEPIAFLPQTDYDALLHACDLNFVRGEDSLVRAQWAGRPFVWQIYPQADDAHLDKLKAFLDVYLHDAPEAVAHALRRLFMAWNLGGDDFKAAWSACLAHWPALCTHQRAWSRQLADLPDLASNLVNFCAGKV